MGMFNRVSIILCLVFVIRGSNGIKIGCTTENAGNVKFHVKILKDNEFVCPGTLIRPDYAVTAAHCIIEYHKGLSSWKVVSKVRRRKISQKTISSSIRERLSSDQGLGEEVYKILKVFVFALTQKKEVIASAMGVVQLEELINLEKDEFALLPQPGSDFMSIVTIIGYGTEGIHKKSLMKDEVKIMPTEDCQKLIGSEPYYLHKTMFCIESKDDKGLTEGEEGAPVMSADGKVLVGVVFIPVKKVCDTTFSVVLKFSRFSRKINVLLKKAN